MTLKVYVYLALFEMTFDLDDIILFFNELISGRESVCECLKVTMKCVSQCLFLSQFTKFCSQLKERERDPSIN